MLSKEKVFDKVSKLLQQEEWMSVAQYVYHYGNYFPEVTLNRLADYIKTNSGGINNQISTMLNRKCDVIEEFKNESNASPNKLLDFDWDLFYGDYSPEHVLLNLAKWVNKCDNKRHDVVGIIARKFDWLRKYAFVSYSPEDQYECMTAWLNHKYGSNLNEKIPSFQEFCKNLQKQFVNKSYKEMFFWLVRCGNPEFWISFINKDNVETYNIFSAEFLCDLIKDGVNVKDYLKNTETQSNFLFLVLNLLENYIYTKSKDENDQDLSCILEGLKIARQCVSKVNYSCLNKAKQVLNISCLLKHEYNEEAEAIEEKVKELIFEEVTV
jgi:hypothetical protein